MYYSYLYDQIVRAQNWLFITHHVFTETKKINGNQKLFTSPHTTRSPCGPGIVENMLKRKLKIKLSQISIHLFLLAGSEIVLNVEGFSNFLGGLPLDHVGHCLAGHIQQSLQQNNV